MPAGGLLRRCRLAGPGRRRAARRPPPGSPGRRGGGRSRPAAVLGRGGRRARDQLSDLGLAPVRVRHGSRSTRPAAADRRPTPGPRATRRSTPRRLPIPRRPCCSATPGTTRPRRCCSGLARGSGTRSLAGMATRGPAGWLRPLLGVAPRRHRAGLPRERPGPWRDPHNADPAFARVRVRHTVLPTLEAELGPGIAEALARTADAGARRRRPARPAGRGGGPGDGHARLRCAARAAGGPAYPGHPPLAAAARGAGADGRARRHGRRAGHRLARPGLGRSAPRTRRPAGRAPDHPADPRLNPHVAAVPACCGGCSPLRRIYRAQRW